MSCVAILALCMKEAGTLVEFRVALLRRGSLHYG